MQFYPHTACSSRCRRGDVGDVADLAPILIVWISSTMSFCSASWVQTSCHLRARLRSHARTYGADGAPTTAGKPAQQQRITMWQKKQHATRASQETESGHPPTLSLSPSPSSYLSLSLSLTPSCLPLSLPLSLWPNACGEQLNIQSTFSSACSHKRCFVRRAVWRTCNHVDPSRSHGMSKCCRCSFMWKNSLADQCG